MTAVTLERPSDGVVEITLNRPDHRNALNTELLLSLRRCLAVLEEDREVRVVILSGAGSAFCGGADTREFAADADPADTLGRVRLVIRSMTDLLQLEAVTIALVHGPAVGAGWGLALACGLCWATDDASFSLPEVPKGYRLPRLITTRLSQIVGPARAGEIVLSGTELRTGEAISHGLVTRRFDDTSAMRAEAIDFARMLARTPRRVVQGAMDPLRFTPPRAVPELDYQWPER